MRPCQKEHFNRKKDSYRKKINDCKAAIDEQNKRIACFQGLIKQLDHVLKENDDRAPKI